MGDGLLLPYTNSQMKILFILFFGLIACRNASTTIEPVQANTTDTIPTPMPATSEIAIDAEDAVAWLTEVIESHLNEGGYAMEDICTPKYYEYKTDATQVGYDGGMDEDAFNKKWASTYDVKHAGIGTAFLISGQDNGKVKVTKCVPKPTTTSDAIILEVVISDPDMNATYHRDFKVIPIGKAYQIDDVVEFD
jgi:hypothetical protein